MKAWIMNDTKYMHGAFDIWHGYIVIWYEWFNTIQGLHYLILSQHLIVMHETW